MKMGPGFPKITVLISTYNRPDFLKLALLSLEAQSARPDEVVVADDGSKEDLPGLLRELRGRLSFPVKYVTHADDGFRLARCRNNGIRIASGDVIYSTDQDIVFTRDFLKTLKEAIRPGEFIVSSPVRLTREQSLLIDEERILASSYGDLLSNDQLGEVRKQYVKDRFYAFSRALHLRRTGPKLRGGVFAAWREDLLKVNGFDENYVGWGNEDDDLGHRLYAAGIKGRNITVKELPLHLYHPVNNPLVKRPNLAYYRQRLKAIKKGDFKAVKGLTNPSGEDRPLVLEY